MTGAEKYWKDKWEEAQRTIEVLSKKLEDYIRKCRCGKKKK